MSAVTETERYDPTVDAPATGQPRTAASVRAGMTNLANRAKWFLARMGDFLGIANDVTNVDASTNTITVANHGWSAAQPVRFSVVGGTLPGGLTAGAVVYVRNPLTNTFEVAATAGGAAIDITSAGSGTIYVWPVVDAAAALFSPESGVIPAGSLRSQLSYIRDTMAKLASPNTWMGIQTFLGAVFMSDLTMSGTSKVKLESRSVTRRSRAAPFGAVNFSINDGYVEQSSTSASQVSWELDVPDGATLTAVTIEVQPNIHPSNRPGTMPKLRVLRTAANQITGQIVGSVATDLSGSHTAYNGQHPITVTGLSELIDRSQYNYWARLDGETGSDAMTGLQAGTPKWTATVSQIPDA